MCNTIEYNLAKNSSYTWFQSVYIHKQYRGKKIFSALYQRTLEEAKKAGHAGLKLYVERNNDTARAVYSHYGFSFPRCEIFESDLIFAFNSLDFDVKKMQENFDTFKKLYSGYKEDLVSNNSKLDLKLSVSFIERDGSSKHMDKLIETDWSGF